MLTVSSLEKTFGGRTLFQDVTFRLSPGRCVALVGANGVGKSTLLEIIVGQQNPDQGQVSAASDYQIGYLPQELIESWTDTVLAEVMSGAKELVELSDRITAIGSQLEVNPNDDVLAAYGEAQSQYEALGGYHLEAEARRILGGLGFSTADMDRPLKSLSGGWQMRAVLARLLLQKPDLLVLDEPTNHLDLDSVAWLEQQLSDWSGAVLFVSHDRDFIDAIANRVIEIAWGTANEYVGGFAEFLVARQERITIAEATAARQAKEVARVERFVNRFRYKATKAKQVQSRIKALEKLDNVEVPDDRALKVKFNFGQPPRSSRAVLELANVSGGYDGSAIFTGVDLVLERGDKIGLVGPNGAGKSTLIKLILGQLDPLDGLVTVGSNVQTAYFAQHQVEALDLEKTVEQEFRQSVGSQPKNRNLRTVLGSFGFSGDSVDRHVRDLSGGERTRLALAEVMCNPVNLLVLDEPTNHLDLPSRDVLEDALRAYPGTVLLVSHDRYLIRNTMTQILKMRDGTTELSPDVEAVMFPAATPKPTTVKQKPEQALAPKPSSQQRRQQQKRLARAERSATRAEERVAELEKQLAAPEIYEDQELTHELLTEHAKAQSAAEAAIKEWERLTNLLDGV